MARHSRSSWPRMMSALVLPGVLILLVALALEGCGSQELVALCLARVTCSDAPRWRGGLVGCDGEV